MSSFSKLRQTIENANDLGRAALKSKGVQVNGKETTYEIMKKISQIQQTGGTVVPPISEMEYKSVTYNEDDTITFIDKDDVEHIMECMYEDGKMVGIIFDGGEIELCYEDEDLIGIGTTAVDMSAISETGDSLEYSVFEHGTYIESDGTQYIDLGVKAKSGLRIIFDVGLEKINVQQTLFGSSETGAKNRIQTYVHDKFSSTTWSFYYYYYTDNYKYYQFPIGRARCTCFEIHDTKLYEHGVPKITNPQADFSSALNMYLFALNDAGTPSQFSNIKVYRFTVIDNDEVVLDLVPTVSKETGHENEVCMWDKVSSRYFYNQGTGAFILGNDFAINRE